MAGTTPIRKTVKTDLHIHTVASDGQWEPEEVVEQALAAGLGLIAVTDHDSTGSVARMTVLARAAGLGYLTGVEINSTLNDRLYHLLGYDIDPLHPGLARLLRRHQELMEETDRESIRLLAAQGVPVDLEEYSSYRYDAGRGGWKSLNYLVDKELCLGVKDFFARLFTAERGIGFAEFTPPAEVIAVIRAAGGVPILAHPGSEFHGVELEEALDYFGREDIAGVECYHPGHDPRTAETAAAWCRRHGLLITGGSDCHGGFVPGRCLGVPAITAADLELGPLWERAIQTMASGCGL